MPETFNVACRKSPKFLEAEALFNQAAEKVDRLDFLQKGESDKFFKISFSLISLREKSANLRVDMEKANFPYSILKQHALDYCDEVEKISSELLGGKYKYDNQHICSHLSQFQYESYDGDIYCNAFETQQAIDQGFKEDFENNPNPVFQKLLESSKSLSPDLELYPSLKL